MIGIMTERESIGLRREGEKKGKRGRERGRGRNRQKNSKKVSLKRCSHKPEQYYSKKIFAFHAIPEISSLAGAFEWPNSVCTIGTTLKAIIIHQITLVKSESNTKTFLRGLEEWVTSKDYVSFWTFFLISNSHLNHKSNATCTSM